MPLDGILNLCLRLGMRPPIGHLDVDCCCVSAECVRDPFLLGKPVGVLGNQGACVIAKDYQFRFTR